MIKVKISAIEILLIFGIVFILASIVLVALNPVCVPSVSEWEMGFQAGRESAYEEIGIPPPPYPIRK